MMRLAPRTLFGRLMLVLVAGLVLALAVSIAINLRERDSVLARASGMRPVQRIAEIVHVLEPLAPGERERIASILSVPPMRLSLAPGPAQEAGAGPAGPHAAMFGAMLRAALGDDRPVHVSMVNPPPWVPPGPGRMADGGDGQGWPHMGRGMHRYGDGPRIFVQVRLADGTWAEFDTRVPESTRSLPWRLLTTLAVLLAAVLLLSWFAVRAVTRPLKVLSNAAEELGRDLYRPPLPETGPEEVGNAARAFNGMQKQLVGMIEERVRVLTAMSHDLKTPITRMRLRAELMDDAQLRAKFEADLLEMEAMVTEALEFMRGLSAHEAEEPIDIAALLEQVRADNAAMGREVTVQAGAVAPFTGAPRLLKRCIANLVDNAVIYGKSAEISVSDGPQSLEIRVRDHGPGIPERDLERVFEPFHRLEGSRSRETGGTGLGLSIARNIARAHRGDVRLRNAPGGGLEAVLTLPRHS